MVEFRFQDELEALKTENRRLLRDLERQGGLIGKPGQLGDRGRPGEGIDGDEHRAAAPSAVPAAGVDSRGTSAVSQDDPPRTNGSLEMSLGRLAIEIVNLRSELAATRESLAATAIQPGQPSYSLNIRPEEEPDYDGVIVDVTTDGVWQRMRRPWFYLPLLWGLMVLTGALGYFAYVAA